MKSILVVDDMAVFREPIAASLRLAGYETLCAADGVEALQITRANCPDLILLDVSMPKMDGMTFLKHLRADSKTAKTPVILLTALTEKKYVLAAASFGVRDYLLKSRFRLADLLKRVQKFSAPAASLVKPPVTANAAGQQPTTQATANLKGMIQVPQLLERNQFVERVESVFQAKTLSGVVAQVISVASSPTSEMSQLANLISRDPMLSARVLQAANSACYTSAGLPVTTIADAIRKVGFTAVRNIAAAVGVFDCMPEAGADGFNPIRCWQHSFAVAQLCEKLASVKMGDKAGLAYVIGLCHDLGEIFIRTQFGKEHSQVAEAVVRTGRPWEELHREMLGMTPAQMIGSVLKCMGLPDEIREPIQIFHSRPPRESIADSPLVGILWLAENYANGALLASSPASEVTAVGHAICRTTTGSPSPERPDPQTLRSEVQSLTVMLARLSRADEAKLLAPMFKTSQAKVWVARAPSMSVFDPVTAALESLSKTSVNQRLPMGQEFDSIDGLVIVAPSHKAAGFTQQDTEKALAQSQIGCRTVPVLAIASDQLDPEQPHGSVPWHSSISLSKLSTYVEQLQKSNAAQAAA